MTTFLTLLKHPFSVLILSLIFGSLFIFNNEKYADSSIPVLWHGSWSIYLGVLIYLVGLCYLGYAIYSTVKKNQQK